MATAPTVLVRPSDSGADGKIDTAPAWLVYFVRFKEPTTNHTTYKNYMDTENGMIVINDCISATVNNIKGQAGNTATLIMKEGEIFYPYAVSPGDWCFIWMCDNRDDIDKVFRWLQDSKKKPQRKPNSYWSGLKFAGRVANLGNIDTTSADGTRTITQNINCQSFLEMASTVYFTSFAKDIIDSEIGRDKAPAPKVQPKGASEAEGEASTATTQGDAERFINRILERAIGKNDFRKFDRFFGEFNAFGRSPDSVLSYVFTSLMGLDPIAFQAAAANATSNVVPTFSTAIQIPSKVANIFGKQSGGKHPLLWQMYNIVLGVQQFNPAVDPKRPWTSFFPKLRDAHSYEVVNQKTNKSQTVAVTGAKSGALALGGTNNIFYKCPIALEGRVKYFPPLWDNKSIWGFMEENLNNLINEMYTCLRPGPNGDIVPTLFIREKPFSTGLFNWVAEESIKAKKDREAAAEKAIEEERKKGPKANEKISATKQAVLDAQNAAKKSEKTRLESEGTGIPPSTSKKKAKGRTNFFNVPRWIIPQDMVTSINVNQSEQNRINMTMVVPNNRYNYIQQDGLSQEALMKKVYTDGTFVVDPEDVARNGLRADINNTNFDFIDADETTVAVIWARMRADWMFNGHLKLQGNITLKGVQLPITEGDNLEFDGIVFHIESISHQASVAPSGVKTFNTQCQLSNGLLATSGDIWKQRPNYYTYRRGSSDFLDYSKDIRVNDAPGLTDSQQTEHRNRDIKTGNKVKKRRR